MTEWASTIAALITGAMIGLIVGMWIAGDMVPSVTDCCTHRPVSETAQ